MKTYSANMGKSFVYACLYFSLCYKNGKNKLFCLKILNKTNLFELILVFNFLVFGWFLEKLIIVWEGGETTISCNTTPACKNE